MTVLSVYYHTIGNVNIHINMYMWETHRESTDDNDEKKQASSISQVVS